MRISAILQKNVFWVDGIVNFTPHLDVNAIQMWCEIYNTIYPEYIFLEDCAYSHTFINGIQTNNAKYNLLLCQSKEKLRKSRKILAESGYYEHWNDAMMKEILGKDFDVVNHYK